jgi:hypothetical protein
MMSSACGPPSRSASRVALALISLLLLSGRVAAADGPLTVRLGDETALETAGREAITLAAIVQNTGPSTRNLALDALLPQDWASLAPEDTFSLDAGAEDLRLVGVLVPALATAGTYEIACRVRDVDEPRVESRATAKVTVRATPALETRLLESPQVVTAGETYESVFSLRNAGNTVLRVDLEIHNSPDFPYTVLRGPPVLGFQMPPGDQKDVSVLVRTDPDLRSSVQHMLTVTARAQDATSVPTKSATSRVEVVPLATSGISDEVHTLRAVLGTSGKLDLETGDYGMESAIDAAGTLDEAGRHRLELHLNKAFDPDQPFLANSNDRYRLLYGNRWMELDLGDGRYPFSPLMGGQESGRGVRGSLLLGPLHATGLYYQNISAATGSRAAGANLGVKVSGGDTDQPVDYRVDLSMLANLDGRTTYGLWQQVAREDSLGLQIDAAVQNDRGGRICPALYTAAHGDGRTVFGRLGFSATWAGYRDSETNQQSIQASAGMRLMDRNLVLFASYGTSGADLFTDLVSSLTSSYRAVLGLRGSIPAWGTQLSVEGEEIRQDRSTADRVLRLGGAQRLGRFGLSLSSALEEDGGFKHAASVQAKLSGNLGATTSLEWSGRDDLASTGWRNLQWGATVSAGRASTRLGAHIGLDYLRAAGKEPGLSGQTDLRFSHAFPGGPTLAVAVTADLEQRDKTWEPGCAARLAFSLPLDIPVSRKTPAAVVRGRLYRVETGQPMVGSIVRLGGRAASTNSRGEFVFRLPEKGTYYLSVDRSRLGFSLIPSQADPMVVDATQRESRVEVGIVQAGSVRGNVAIYGFPRTADAIVDEENGVADAQRVRQRGVANAMVELANDLETRRTTTDANGDFSFPEVRPGPHAVKVVNGAIPAYHHVVPGSREIDVQPGSKQSVEFQVIQEQRRIRILQPEATIEIDGRP